MSILNGIQTFCLTNKDTIAALGTVGTFAAVITSLVLARRADATRVSARAYIGLVPTPGIGKSTLRPYLMLKVRNLGVMTATLPWTFRSFRPPFGAKQLPALPVDGHDGDPLVVRKTYPIQLPPRTSAEFMICAMKAFEFTCWNNIGECRRSTLNRIRMRLLGFIVTTDDGRQIRASVDPVLRREMDAYFRPES